MPKAIWVKCRHSITQEPKNYFSSLKGEVAIKINPIIPMIILADKGRASNTIKIAPINARIIPIINCVLFIFFAIFIIKNSIFIKLSFLRAPNRKTKKSQKITKTGVSLSYIIK